MSAATLLKRYNIKLPKNLGKILYIQPIDIKKQIVSMLGLRIAQIGFSLFGFSISLIMLYSFLLTHDIWHGIIGVLFFPFLFMILFLLIALFRASLIIVCDKGIARYTLNYSHQICNCEFFLFEEATHSVYEEGFVDPYSPVSKKGYRVALKWFKESKELFCIDYLREDEKDGFHPDKEAAQVAKDAFIMFRARTRQKL